MPRQRKISLVKTLVRRAVAICSTGRLDQELVNIKNIFLDNGYPGHVIDNAITSQLSEKTPSTNPQKCPVYLRLPYIGNISTNFERTIKKTIGDTYFACQTRIIFTTRPMIQPCLKDKLPTQTKSNVIYEFKCLCGDRYVGKTTQRLSDRISQHVPSHIRRRTEAPREQPQRGCKRQSTLSTDGSSSAIAEHLLFSDNCAAGYNNSMFRILHQCRSSHTST